MRISDWSSDVCSSDLMLAHRQIIVRAPDRDRLRPVMPGEASRVGEGALVAQDIDEDAVASLGMQSIDRLREDARIIDGGRDRLLAHTGSPTAAGGRIPVDILRSEEHTSELQSLMRISYAVFCLK